MYLTGDIDIDTLCLLNASIKKYLNVLNQFNLKQILDKPTRITKDAASRIDHIIVRHPELVKVAEILPCKNINDHDGPYAFLNIHMPRYEPCFKMIRDEKALDSRAFKEDVSRIPLSSVYSYMQSQIQIKNCAFSILCSLKL